MTPDLPRPDLPRPDPPRPELRKGWCPGALRPMMARDGLLVRLRITGGIVPAEIAGTLADLADAYGNGLFDLSARANLQMRGVGEHTLPALLDGLRELGLLDADAASEAVRNIIASPLAGLGSGLDIRPITARLDATLAEDKGLHGLPGKFGFLIDAGGTPTLAGVAADVRFDWSAAHHAFAVGLGGTRAAARFAGFCAAEAVVARAQDIAGKVVALQDAGEPGRRMRGLLHDLGPAAAELFGTRPARPYERGADVQGLAGRQIFGDQPVLGLAVPFGRLDAAMLRAAATVADRELGELRLTPWRTILVPDARHARPPRLSYFSMIEGISPPPCGEKLGVGAHPLFSVGRKERYGPASLDLPKCTARTLTPNPSPQGGGETMLDCSRAMCESDSAGPRAGHYRATASASPGILPPHPDSSWPHTAGFITDPTDPRLRVAACAGREGCARGTTATHADATALADIAGALGAEPTPLHVSGCEKGCAKPSRSAVTLVGREGRYDLVRDGRPGDPPLLRGLDLAQVRVALAHQPVRERVPI